ncbi:hypothetical protein TIFTF001_050209 [Ficus carica]|uniref:Uncharacterized protein n=1 Tax=Ficus carica TaxID=3494 RepID=A0AA87YT29_FICCA|nr:hypothetical protein TIFTF001_050200 [Ficus carica]GMN22423.1 hypothetical protein TIFTF001_050209 [Ficus carica]
MCLVGPYIDSVKREIIITNKIITSSEFVEGEVVSHLVVEKGLHLSTRAIKHVEELQSSGRLGSFQHLLRSSKGLGYHTRYTPVVVWSVTRPSSIWSASTMTVDLSKSMLPTFSGISS